MPYIDRNGEDWYTDQQAEDGLSPGDAIYVGMGSGQVAWLLTGRTSGTRLMGRYPGPHVDDAINQSFKALQRAGRMDEDTEWFLFVARDGEPCGEVLVSPSKEAFAGGFPVLRDGAVLAPRGRQFKWHANIYWGPGLPKGLPPKWSGIEGEMDGFSAREVAKHALSELRGTIKARYISGESLFVLKISEGDFVWAEWLARVAWKDQPMICGPLFEAT